MWIKAILKFNFVIWDEIISISINEDIREEGDGVGADI